MMISSRGSPTGGFHAARRIQTRSSELRAEERDRDRAREVSRVNEALRAELGRRERIVALVLAGSSTPRVDLVGDRRAGASPTSARSHASGVRVVVRSDRLGSLRRRRLPLSSRLLRWTSLLTSFAFCRQGLGGSNPRPADLESAALPTELNPLDGRSEFERSPAGYSLTLESRTSFLCGPCVACRWGSTS